VFWFGFVAALLALVAARVGFDTQDLEPPSKPLAAFVLAVVFLGAGRVVNRDRGSC